MVADRQPTQSCDEDVPSVTSSNKKARSTTPLNLYRPPALRKRIEESEVCSRNSAPGEVEAPKVERVRPAKQRRPDIQVYVPRAKRILAVPEEKAKAAVTLHSTQTENRKTLVSKKNDKKESQRTRTKTKSSESGSLGQQTVSAGDEKNDLSDIPHGKSVSKEGEKYVEFPETCHETDQSKENRLIASNQDLQTPADHNVSKKPIDAEDENCDRSLLFLDDSSGAEVDSDIKIETSDSSVLDESRTVLDTSFCEECETPQEDLNNCRTCCKVLRLCQCSNENLVGCVTESSELSTCSASSGLSENIGDEGSIEEMGGDCVEANNTSNFNFNKGCDELHSFSYICDTEKEANKKSTECNSVLEKMSLEDSGESVNLVSELCANDKQVQEQCLAKENELCSCDKSTSETEDTSNETLAAIDTSNGIAVSDLVLDRRKSNTDEKDKLTLSGNVKQANTVESCSEKPVQVTGTPVKLNRDECTWEMMFDDNGDCLDPSLIEEITSAVGSVKIEKPKSDYNNYQNKPEIYLDPGDEFSHVVEIYNFPAAFKTEDLVTIFSPYRNGGFEIKWVDNTHALGVFSSAFVAAEVLAADHPFVKTRPLREASHESRMKARRSAEFLQPYKERPETCAALARRLVTGALGVKLNTSREEREAERKVLREAREKKRLAAKQREEIWEGTFSAN